MGVAGGSEKVAPFFLGQAKACHRLMEDVSAENFIHTLFSQDRVRHSLQFHLTINIQQALTQAICDVLSETLILYIWMLY